MVERYGFIDAASGYEPLYFGKTTDLVPHAISGPEYVLHSVFAELEAENERMKRVNNGLHDEVQFMRQAAKEAREALSRTGAVKETDVMVCPQCEGEGTYADGLDDAACTTTCTRCESNGWIVNLSSHPRATNTVVSHETGNVEDKIERDGLPRYQLSEGAQERISLLLFEFSATSDHARVAVRLEDLRLLARLAGVKPHKVD